MANTARGYPYPLSSDPVAQGATAIQNLATAVDTKLGVAASGQATVTASNSSNAQATVTFPAGRFTAPPQVVNIPDSGFLCAFVQPPTTTSVTMGVRRADNQTVASISSVLRWIAIQV